jgi:NAD(P)-dependent dehydrogenase (short-subunit alcohol dehydrogenase family)
MEKQGGGVIVNISSIAAIRYTGVPYVTYYTTKAGILGLTQGIALQYAEKNIRANAILPGLMNTPMIVEPLKGVYGGGDVEKMIEIRNKQCPTGKMGDAWDVAHAAYSSPQMRLNTSPVPNSSLMVESAANLHNRRPITRGLL